MQLQNDQIQKRLTSLIDATQKLIGMTEPEELLQHIWSPHCGCLPRMPVALR